MIQFLATGAILFGAAVPAAQGYSERTAKLRIVNAVADQHALNVYISERSFGVLGFGQRSEYFDAATRRPTFRIEGVRGERLTNESAFSLQPSYPHTLIMAGYAAVGRVMHIVLRDTTAGRPSTTSAQITYVNALSDYAPVTIKVDGKKLNRTPVLAFGAQTATIGYNPGSYEFAMEDAAGKELYKTTFQAAPGARYTAIAMGAQGQPGGRSPRLNFYSF